MTHHTRGDGEMGSYTKTGPAGLRRRRAGSLGLLLAVAIAVVAVLGVFTASASATITHEPEPFSPITGAGSGLVLSEPGGGITVDEATGNVFVADGSPGNQVAILGGEGGVPVELVSPFSLSVPIFGNSSTTAVAYDGVAASSGKGTLYVYNESTEEIDRYVRNAASELFELTGEMALPGAGDSATTAAIDGVGDLYVASRGAQALFKFSPSGALLAKYELSSEHTPGQMVFDNAGDLFAAEDSSGVYKYPVNGSGEIESTVHAQFASGFVRGVAYDPASNHLYVTTEGGSTGLMSVEYSASTGVKISEFARGAWNVQLAVNSATKRIYGSEWGTPYGGGDHVNVYGPAVIVPTTVATAATNVTGTKATLNGNVNPENIAVSECKFEYGATTSYGKTVSCEGSLPTNSEADPVSANIAGLTYNGVTYHYRLVAKNANGTEYSADKTLVTATTVATEAATSVGTSTATLNGLVRPEGLQYGECKFEYGLVTTAGFEQSEDCHPPAAEIESDFLAHSLTLGLSGLQANSTYKFRVTATNVDGALSGKELTFTTLGPPQVSGVQALDATQTAVTLQATIDPSGFGTSYRFEWGAGPGYGNNVPVDFEPYIGSGTEPVTVTAHLAGLSARTVYHYRVVATSVAGPSVVSPDSEMETLDSCGLPDGRCFELVSPHDSELGVAAIPTEYLGATQLPYQAGVGSGSLAYLVNGGLPDATRGTEVLYRGTRGEAGWGSSQLSPPVTARNEHSGGSATPESFYALSADLSCGFFGSTQPLSEDPASKLILEAGGANLYRLNADGSYTLITTRPPEQLKAAAGTVFSEFTPVGMSSDCSHFVFATNYVYPGAPGAGTQRLYEWSEANGLKSVGWVPNVGGEAAVEAVGGAGNSQNHSGGNQSDAYHAVSEDGSRVFFTATRPVAGNHSDPGEVGKRGVFVRENGTVTRDVSASQTSIADMGARYEAATPDGSRVYFLANAGLTTEGSVVGTDLYEYDLQTEKLVDLSVDREPGGAEVGGLIGVADDGSNVYFAARGQLVAGRGGTFAQNTASNTFSVYDQSGGTVHFVGAVSGQSALLERVIISDQVGNWTSRVSADGRYLVFESNVNFTGYESGGPSEAYLYDASTGATVCVSCRQDGRPSVNTGSADRAVLSNVEPAGPLYARRSLVVRDGRPLVFFSTGDALAPGAVEGRNDLGNGARQNLYEWAHGQVFLVASEAKATGGFPTVFFGASEDGTDLYLTAAAALNWEDPSGRKGAWDARGGGGFAEPVSPAGCDPLGEGSCQPVVSGQPAAGPIGSLAFDGPSGQLVSTPVLTKPVGTRSGKPAHKRRGKKAPKKRRKGRGHAGGKRAKGRKSGGRVVNGNGRAGK